MTIILIVLFLLFAPYICNCVIGFVSSRMKVFRLRMVSRLLGVPQPPPAITWGPWVRGPQYEGHENMLPQQFRDCTPKQQEVVMG